MERIWLWFWLNRQEFTVIVCTCGESVGAGLICGECNED